MVFEKFCRICNKYYKIKWAYLSSSVCLSIYLPAYLSVCLLHVTKRESQKEFWLLWHVNLFLGNARDIYAANRLWARSSKESLRDDNGHRKTEVLQNKPSQRQFVQEKSNKITWDWTQVP